MTQNQQSFLDVEAILVSWLHEVLDVPVYLDIPDDVPDCYITVERIGGSSTNIVVDRPIISLQAWADSRLGAGTLANNIASSVALMPIEIPRVLKATVSSHQHYPVEEQESTLFRYQIIVDLVTR